MLDAVRFAPVFMIGRFRWFEDLPLDERVRVLVRMERSRAMTFAIILVAWKTLMEHRHGHRAAAVRRLGHPRPPSPLRPSRAVRGRGMPVRRLWATLRQNHGPASRPRDLLPSHDAGLVERQGSHRHPRRLTPPRQQAVPLLSGSHAPGNRAGGRPPRSQRLLGRSARVEARAGRPSKNRPCLNARAPERSRAGQAAARSRGPA